MEINRLSELKSKEYTDKVLYKKEIYGGFEGMVKSLEFDVNNAIQSLKDDLDADYFNLRESLKKLKVR